eukprot:919856-Amorphochlora_amoeboformis.AAC.1
MIIFFRLGCHSLDRRGKYKRERGRESLRGTKAKEGRYREGAIEKKTGGERFEREVRDRGKNLRDVERGKAYDDP